MALKQLALSPVQWLLYFREHPDTLNELVDCQLQLEKADTHDDKFDPLKQACDALQPKLADIEKFQNDFSRRVGGVMITEQELKEELMHSLRGQATAHARSTGAKSVSEMTAARRATFATKPDISGMTPEEGKKATAVWEQEQRDELEKANRVESTESNDAAANAMAEEMNRSFSLDKITAIIQLANKVLQFLTHAAQPATTP